MARNSSVERGIAKGDAADTTAEFMRKEVCRFKLDSVFREKPQASAKDDTQPSTQPQNLPDDDTPRQAMIKPPVDEATGLSELDRKYLDVVWDRTIRNNKLDSIWDDEETHEAHEDEETHDARAELDSQFAHISDIAVANVCTHGAVTIPTCSGSPAVVEITQCESAAVAVSSDAHWFRGWEREHGLSMRQANRKYSLPRPKANPDQNLGLAEAVRSQSQTVVEMDLPTQPISLQPQDSPMLPQSTARPMPRPQSPPRYLVETGSRESPRSNLPVESPQQQPQQQALPQQLPPLTGLAPPSLTPPPAQPPFRSSHASSSSSPTPEKAPPQNQAPPSKPGATLNGYPPSPTPDQAPPQEQAPPSKRERPHAPRPTRSPPQSIPSPSPLPSAASLLVPDPSRLDPSVSQSLGDSPDRNCRSAVATSASQRAFSPVASVDGGYESEDPWEDEPLPCTVTRFTLPQASTDGNITVQLYNWGTRSNPHGVHDNDRKRASRQCMDDHLKKSAAQINVCLECNVACEEVLRAPPMPGAENPRMVETKPNNPKSRGVVLADRPSWEHHVGILECNGSNQDTLMIAARKTKFASIEVLWALNMNEKPHASVNSRLLICKATAHRPIYSLGTEIIILAAHGHCETMKKPGSQHYKDFYDTVQAKIIMFNPHFFVGDFNMGLMLVPTELSRRGLPCQVLAYYPWAVKDSLGHGRTIGLDSCGMFWTRQEIVESRVNWGSTQINKLVSCGDPKATTTSDWNVELHTYKESKYAPGQLWHCYRYNSDGGQVQSLRTLLEGFFSTTTPQEAFASPVEQAPVQWTRFRQKALPQDSVFVNGKFHNGAHMSLMVVTDNPKSARSNDAKARIRKNKYEKWQQKLETRATSKPRSPSRARSQSKSRWYESAWTRDCHWNDASWSSHDWNNASWGGHQWNNGKHSW